MKAANQQKWGRRILRNIRICLCPFVVLFSVSRAESVRVVSQTVGSDELLLAIAAPEQIAALSHISTETQFSAVAEEARRYPQIAMGDAETILKYHPTLVLGADYSRGELLDQIERAGVKVIRFSHYDSLADAYGNLRLLAKELGAEAEARAERVIMETEARVTALRKRLAGVELVKVIAPSTYGVIGGTGTTFQDLCDHAGAQNLAATVGGLEGHATAPTESMLTWPVEKVVVSGEDAESALAPYRRILPYQFMDAVRESRVALIEPYMMSSVSHHRVDGYERLARELHPEVFDD